MLLTGSLPTGNQQHLEYGGFSVFIDGALQETESGHSVPSRISDETRYRYHSTYTLRADVTSKTTTSSATRAVKILSVFR
ncbi:TPA: hypothetical protein ACLGW6_000351 [Salmonella enterica]